VRRAGNNSEAVKVLVDTDIGSEIDDALALAYLACHPACDVVGVTTVTHDAEARAKLASAICRAAGQPFIPIHPGREQALAGDSFQRASAQASALSALDHQSVFSTPDPARFLRRAISEHSGEVVLLAIGPLTHVAELFESDAQIPSRLRRLVTMGGNFSANHSSDDKPSVEWNTRLDPEAADIVFRTTVAGGHYIVGLETTQSLRLPAKALLRRPQSAALQAVLKLHQTNCDPNRPLTTYDLVAAILALNPQLGESERGIASVALTQHRGSTSWQANHRMGRHLLFTSLPTRKIIREFLLSFHPNGEEH
jgi:purine nucleosidase